MLANRPRRAVFVAFSLLVFSIFLTGFTKPERKVDLPDLMCSRVTVIKLSNTTFYYVFTIQNNGRGRANLGNMKIQTSYSWDGYTHSRTDKYTKMRYDSPPNPITLNPGQSTSVRFKISTDGRQLPGFFVVDLLLDINESVLESNENNNSGNGNSIGLG